MINVNQQTRKITLAPLEVKEIPFTGSYISILSNTSPSTDVIVRADDGSQTPCKAGVGFPTVQLSPDRMTHIPAVFKKISFSNPSSTETITIEYLLSLGEVNDTRTVVQGYIQMDLSAPKIITPSPLLIPEFGHKILSPDMYVKERIITNTGGATVWFGDENVNAVEGRGTPIFNRQSFTINCHGAIYFQSEGGAGKISINNIYKI